ncbi:MAG: hypothetical protein AB1696_24895 [Planctomycetota bacterium]
MKRTCRLLPVLAAVYGLLQMGNATADKPSAEVPKGYRLLYSQDFESADAVKDFEFSDPAQWKVTKKDGRGVLEFGGKGAYKPKVRSPHVIGLISGRKFGDFILEVDLLQTGKEYGHRDMCIFFGFTDPSKFYYVHIATKTDDHAHNIFIVNDAPRTKISTKTTAGVDWGKDQWHKVRLERDASTGAVKVFFDDMAEPIMTAEDKTFPVGLIGFGSFDDSGLIANIKIWGKKMDKEKTDFFGRK